MDKKSILSTGAGAAQQTLKLSQKGSIWIKSSYAAIDSYSGPEDEKLVHYLRYLPTKGDDIHHILPKAGPSKNVAKQTTEYNDIEDVEGGPELAKYFNELRAELNSKGITVHSDPSNLVALPRRWHRLNTFRVGYYERIRRAFGKPIKKRTAVEYRAILNKLAIQLLHESNKLE